MGKGGNQIQETAQQRAMADFAKDQLADYQKRWLPVQQQLATQIQSMGKPGSAAREAAAGRASTDTAIQFSQAQGALEKTLANTGANVNSSRTKLAVSGMGADAAKTSAMGHVISDQQIDDAYTQGLSALTAIGRGEKADVASGLQTQAQTSAAQAKSSADISLAEHAGNAQIAGNLAGFGLYSAMNSPGTGFQGAPGGYTGAFNTSPSSTYSTRAQGMGPPVG